ncbi:MAG: MerR family transcriptional regulator [candidate division Zixibacteria bacterium]|nr:MerR family transcriptional regulator [candidate division Zixibacteria bacterium]
MRQKAGDKISGKLYYSIREVSEITSIKPYVLRFWEKEFPTLRPKKNRAGNRTYQLKDIELVKQIKNLLYDEGYTIEGARSQLRGFKASEAINVEKVEDKEIDKDKMKNLLRDIKQELGEILKIIS